MPALIEPPGELMYSDVLLAVRRGEQQELGADPVRHLVVDLAAEEDDPLAEQPLEDLIVEGCAVRPHHQFVNTHGPTLSPVRMPFSLPPPHPFAQRFSSGRIRSRHNTGT